MNSDKRNDARRQIQEFFDEKREIFFKIEFPEIKRRFLGETNSLAKEMEFLVSDLSDKGKPIEPALDKAKVKFEKLKKQFLKSIPNDPILGIPYKKLRELLKEM